MKLQIGLLFIWIGCFIGYSSSAPLVSSVHVRFISGNQATQYGHGSLADGTSLHYNTVDIGLRGHEVQRRSVTVPTPTRLTATLTSTAQTQRLAETPTVAESSLITVVPATSVEIHDLPVTLDRQTREKKKSKKGGAVKRSPLSRTFGFFPDFNDHGNEFRSPFRRPKSQKLVNAESLAPEGLFLPPIPTSATNHLDEDTYAVDAESAKYAAKHPPYFHEFPHKRAVLYLNEDREENGLEPNILRSIRPFFPFFEINK